MVPALNLLSQLLKKRTLHTDLAGNKKLGKHKNFFFEN